MREFTRLIYGREPFSDWVKKSIISIISSIGIGLSVALMLLGNVGTDPVTLFITAISDVLGISVGTGMTVFNSSLILFLLIFGRKYIYTATIANTAFSGVAIDIFLPILQSFGIEITFISGLIICIIGLALLGFFIGLYISLDFGGGPVDGVEYFLSVKINKPFNIAQLIFYAVAFVFGMLLGGVAGIGTVIGLFIPALTSGPTIKFLNKRWSKILKLKQPIAVVK